MAGVLVTPTLPSSTGRTIKRRPAVASFTMSTVLADCDVLDMSQLAGAAIKLPASVTGYTAYGCDTASGTFTAIHGTAVALTSLTALDWYDLNAACFAFSYVKLQSVAAIGTGKMVAKT